MIESQSNKKHGANIAAATSPTSGINTGSHVAGAEHGKSHGTPHIGDTTIYELAFTTKHQELSASDQTCIPYTFLRKAHRPQEVTSSGAPIVDPVAGVTLYLSVGRRLLPRFPEWADVRHDPDPLVNTMRSGWQNCVPGRGAQHRSPSSSSCRHSAKTRRTWTAVADASGDCQSGSAVTQEGHVESFGRGRGCIAGHGLPCRRSLSE